MPSRLLAFGLAMAGGAMAVDLFLMWSRYDDGLGSNVGWNSGPGFACGIAAVALLVWEGARAAGVWSGWSRDAFAGCLLAAFAGLLGIGNVFYMRYGGAFARRHPDLAYGAWIGLAFALVLLVAAWLRLVEHRRLLWWAWMDERTASRP